MASAAEAGPSASGSGGWFAARLAVFFGALFLIYGIQIPYLPVWLDWRGLSPAEIGLIVAAPYFLRLAFTPAVALAADRFGDHRLALVCLAWAGLATALLLSRMQGFWPIFAVAVPFLLVVTTIMPLTETVAVAGVRASGIDYGRMRLWGSLTFVAASFGGGALVDGFGAEISVLLLAGAAALTVAAAHMLPRRNKADPANDDVAVRRAAPQNALRLARSRTFLIFLLAAGAVQGAHATFYTFGAVHWRAQGISAAWVGGLWTIAIAAEVMLFAASGAVVKRFGAVELLAAGGAAAVVRWTVMSFDPPLAVLAPLQVLHGLTYGAAHLGAIHFINRAVPQAAMGSAQAFYATAAAGVSHGLATLLSGLLYQSSGAYTYLAMTVLAIMGLIASLILLRTWHGQELWPSGEPPAGRPRDAQIPMVG